MDFQDLIDALEEAARVAYWYRNSKSQDGISPVSKRDVEAGLDWVKEVKYDLEEGWER